MGVVYIAHDPQLQRTVAIKTIRIGGLSTQVSLEYERRFLTEARSAARLSHPAIVSVHDTGRDDEVTYLVMEYVNGINLKYCLRQGIQFSVVGAVRIALDVLSALEHAHHQKIVHRDIKPENLLLDVAGNIKLTDFGIARMQDGPDNGTMVSGLSIGTPRYMSPEQVQGLEVDARSDLFSAGVMLYELLTSVLPFEGVHPMAVVAKILHVAHAPVQGLRPQVPPELAAVVDKALSKNPDLRYQTAQAFSAALVQACEGVLPLERLTQVTGGSSALALVEPESRPTLLWLLQGAPVPEEGVQEPPGATTGASLAAAAAYAATLAVPAQRQAQATDTSHHASDTGQSPTEVGQAPAPSSNDATVALTPAPAVSPPTFIASSPAPVAQMRGDDSTLSMAWEITTSTNAPRTEFQATVLDVAPSSFSPEPTAPRRRMPAWGPALLVVPALGLAAWLMWGRAPAPAVPAPTAVVAPNTPSEPQEEVISATSSAPLTPGAITPPPLTPPAPPTTNAPTATSKPVAKPKTDPTPATPAPEPTPAPPPPPPPPAPEPKPEPVKPPPPPSEPCQDKEGFFARESCLWDACKLPTYRQMQVCSRFQQPRSNSN